MRSVLIKHTYHFLLLPIANVQVACSPLKTTIQYTRYGFRTLLEKKCADVLQPGETISSSFCDEKEVYVKARVIILHKQKKDRYD